MSTSKADDDEHDYDKMVEFDWLLLVEAVHERRKGVVFWTTQPLEDLEDGLHVNKLPFIPHYTGPYQCNAIDVPFSDG